VNAVLGGLDLPLHRFALYAALLFGVWQVARERWPDTYQFLLTFPFTRGQLVTVKFLFGIATLLVPLVLSVGLLLLAPAILPAVYEPAQVWQWFSYVTPILLVSFAVGFFAATWTGHITASVAAAFALFFWPHLVRFMLFDFFLWDPTTSWGYTIDQVLQTIALDALFIQYVWNTTPEWPPFALTGMTIVLFFFSRIVFQRNYMENNGNLLMWGSPWQFGMVASPLLGGFLLTMVYHILFFRWVESVWLPIPFFLTGSIIGWFLIQRWRKSFDSSQSVSKSGYKQENQQPNLQGKDDSYVGLNFGKRQ
jgi:ABC-type transport system involved in multi-copper enzyme maturation permease subunit